MRRVAHRLEIPDGLALDGHVDPNPPRRRRRLRARYVRVFAVVLPLLAGLRFALPWLVQRYVTKVLNESEGYSCTLSGLEVNLWRGAYEITGVELRREGGTSEHPFVTIERADLSVQWASLLRGRVVAEVVVHQPRMEFVSQASGREAQTGEEESWSEQIAALVPFRIDRFVVRDGEIRFRHEGVEPPVDLFMTDCFLEVLNLTNQPVPEGEQGYMAEAEAAGRPFGTGEFESRLRFDVLADAPRFELDAALRKIDMTALNDFLQAYGKIDAEAGRLDVFAEFAASRGEIQGYVKTLIEGLSLVRASEIEGPVDALQTLWEGFVQLGAELLENQPRDRLAVNVPLRGRIDAAQTDLLPVVGSLLRNAFVIALRPAINDSIQLEDMEVARSEEPRERR